MKRQAKAVALAAVFLALTIVLGAIPYIFLVPVILASITTDFKTSLFISTAFGVISLMYAFMGGSLVAIALVAQPWIPIVGRIFVGPLARGAYLLVDKAFKTEGRMKNILPPAVGAAVGSLANTGIVVALLVLFAGSVSLESVTIAAYVPIMLISGAIELAANFILVPPITIAIRKATVRR